ncbi:proteic killer suppression protein [Parabacteroides sp. PF5-5]|uniref:type II toxin-antitoxin system RelE/ParE family toxin n=1 Tax=unclassified Parabacteroides TaxID=2649774 RepID=UPI002472F0A1|nr:MULTISPECIES: type II toxin-antitoxin system RelE/ParE family toxin [unclassified Parabacteroides]MDH6304664.1 proteic killer suppression protein [Parabacteroides sp. PH5-39]MDH6315722.1 proteic killer suppression protein [Parabacteroides sp. PF5-13]MDH6319382.1 proteic killer suppression protein [Parabacteroides sp. PH5-13]MDH6323113.1 proteic killer suppression protein [Parabacteroides sp. PH5-8]MDH6326915.1 proteic killer suppression protein [Parabacteroides sp. PH5-41]
MIVKFGKKYLSELYYNGKCREKKYRFQPNVITSYKRRIDTLNDSSGIEALYRINSLHYEVLQGDKKGLSSIRVNDQYRIEFEVSKNEEDEIIVTVCTIIELSNHYK